MFLTSLFLSWCTPNLSGNSHLFFIFIFLQHRQSWAASHYLYSSNPSSSCHSWPPYAARVMLLKCNPKHTIPSSQASSAFLPMQNKMQHPVCGRGSPTSLKASSGLSSPPPSGLSVHWPPWLVSKHSETHSHLKAFVLLCLLFLLPGTLFFMCPHGSDVMSLFQWSFPNDPN